MTNCPQCQSPLESPLACAACGSLFRVDRSATPFEVLGLPVELAIDRAELDRRRSRVGRLVHPDFFATRPREERELAEENSARLNEAYATLADDVARAEWIVEHLGGPSADDEREMPRAFLMEVLEWNEALEDVSKGERTPDAMQRLDALRSEIARGRAERLASVARLLVPTPRPASPGLKLVRQELNALRYLERALAEIEALRAGNPAHR